MESFKQFFSLSWNPVDFGSFLPFGTHGRCFDRGLGKRQRPEVFSGRERSFLRSGSFLRLSDHEIVWCTMRTRKCFIIALFDFASYCFFSFLLFFFSFFKDIMAPRQRGLSRKVVSGKGLKQRKVNGQKGPCLADAKMSNKSLRCKSSVKISVSEWKRATSKIITERREGRSKNSPSLTVAGSCAARINLNQKIRRSL